MNLAIETLEELEQAVEDCFKGGEGFECDRGDIRFDATPSDRQDDVWLFSSQFKDWNVNSFTVSGKTLAKKNAPLVAMILADDSRIDELEWGELKNNSLYQSFKKAEKQLVTWLHEEDGDPLDMGDISVVFGEENGLFLYEVTSENTKRDYVDLEDVQALARRILLENIDWNVQESLDLTAVYVPPQVKREIKSMALNDGGLWELKDKTKGTDDMEALLEHIYKTFRLLGLCN